MRTPKCRAQGGVEKCTKINCPEKLARVQALLEQAPTPAAAVAAIQNASWLDPNTVLFKTRHGSHLYGLNHADSDEDFMVVTPTKRTIRKNNAKHKIVDGIDTTTLDFATFVRLAEQGTPQALEGMFSAEPIEDQIAFFRKNFVGIGPEVRRRYVRTIRSFALSGEYKQRRHALRLVLNLKDLMDHGRFEPKLNPEQRELITNLAKADDETYFKGLAELSPIEIGMDPNPPRSDLKDTQL
jgi:hypothetical protein